MEKITSKLYYEITNCSSLPVKPRIEFEIEEIVEILETIGYEVKIHIGPAKVEYRYWETSGEHTKQIKETPNWRCIIAIKPGEIVPNRVDECNDINFMTVWHKEMKKRFKMIFTSF